MGTCRDLQLSFSEFLQDIEKSGLPLGEQAHVSLVARICVGLPAACASLNDEAAGQMLPRFSAVHAAIELLQVKAWSSAWITVLRKLIDLVGLHGLLS